MKSTNCPLIIEPHPDDYTGYKFISLIRYNDENILNIVDNVCNKQIFTYVLDLCGPAQIDESKVITIAEEWWDSGRSLEYPISIEFAKHGLNDEFSKISRAFPIDYVTRVIGVLPVYKMSGASKVRKRKYKFVKDN